MSGDWVWMAVIISTPDLPSTAAWWTLSTKPNAALRHALDGVEALDDVQLPQRPRQVERPGVETGGLHAELVPVAGSRQGDLADVVLEVELAVLDPVRVVEVARHPHDLLAERPGEVEARLEVVEDLGEGDLAAGRASTGRRC